MKLISKTLVEDKVWAKEQTLIFFVGKTGKKINEGRFQWLASISM